MSARVKCQNKQCTGSDHFCNTVIGYCEPCYKNACSKKNHMVPRECCTLCPDFARTAGFDCSRYKPQTTKQVKPDIQARRVKLTTVKVTKTSTTKSIIPSTKSLNTIENRPNGPKPEKVVANGDFNAAATGGANPWLYTTLILATTFVVLVVVVVCLVIFMRSRSKKGGKESHSTAASQEEKQERQKLNNESNSTSDVATTRITNVNETHLSGTDSAYDSQSSSGQRRSQRGYKYINAENGLPMEGTNMLTGTDKTGENWPLDNL